MKKKRKDGSWRSRREGVHIRTSTHDVKRSGLFLTVSPRDSHTMRHYAAADSGKITGR